MIYSIDEFPGRTISVNGKSYLYFGGTSYLGLQTDSSFQDIFIKNVQKYGTNYGASRKANVQLTVFEKAENELANFVGCESCITMSSGYLAGQLVAQSLNMPDYEFFYAPESHSALYIPSKKSFDNFTTLDTAVRNHLKTKNSTPVIFMDSIGIKGFGYPHFEGIKKLPLEQVILVIDDSHGIGIIGVNGCGAFKSAKNLKPKELLLCCSLGKGFGIQAGAVFGSENRIQQFKDTLFFGGASPASPAALGTYLEGKTLFEEKLTLLRNNIQLFLASLKKPEIVNFQENYPAFYFSNPEMATYLERNNAISTNFNYPNKDSPLMSRIVISAAHKRDDITTLTNLINGF